MPKPSPLDLPEEPVDVPAACPDGSSPLADYVALLHRLHEAREEAGTARRELAAAADEAWVAVADAVHDAERALRDALGSDEARAIAHQASRLADRLAALWADRGIRFACATGQRAADLSPEEFEVLTTRGAERPEDDGLVVETWRPAIWRHDALLRTGQIVVARWQPSSSEELPCS